jgi:peroxiredoxin
MNAPALRLVFLTPLSARFAVASVALLAGIFTTSGSAAESSKGGAQRKAPLSLPPDARELKIGDAAPDFKLPGVDGATYTLASFKDARALMVIFMSNHCPYSHAIEDRLMRLIADTKARGLSVVAICPNHPDAVRDDELGYSKYNDSYEEMKLYAKERGFTFPYLYDGDTQATAKAYGCLATPHVFLFDESRRLAYVGRFDDSRFPDPSTVTSPDARNAVEAVLAGKPVPVATTRPVGCSTKWASTKEAVREVDQKWSSTPVALEHIDTAGVAALARNDSNRLRVINVWATWCAPCVKEFPGLMGISRRLANRDCEFITLSIDDPKQEPAVRQFLEKNRAIPSNRLQRLLKKESRTSTNFLYTQASLDALGSALDKEWPGPVPFTVAIAPGGKIVYRHTGELDLGELQDALITQLGAYYK